MLKKWQFWLGVAISTALLYFALRGLHLKQVWESVNQANYWWLIPGILVYFMGVWARAWRWHYLLRPLKKIPTNSMFPIVTMGYMANNIIGVRIGEVLRAVILKDREGVPVSASLATVIVERIFDAVVMLSFVFFNLGALEGLTHDSGFVGNIQQLSIWGTVIFVGALAVFLAAAMMPKKTEQIVYWLIDKVVPVKAREKTRSISSKFLDGLESLRSPKDVLMVFLTTVVIWLFETGKYYFVMLGFNFRVSFFALMLMNGIANLATTLPSAPGNIGTFDAPGIAVLKAYGVPAEMAASYTLVLHAALWLPITLLGLYYYLKQPLRWGKEITREELNEELAEEKTTGVKEEISG